MATLYCPDKPRKRASALLCAQNNRCAVSRADETAAYLRSSAKREFSIRIRVVLLRMSKLFWRCSDTSELVCSSTSSATKCVMK